MVGITSAGIGSGLDVNGLVQQLVAAEAQPVQQRLLLQETRFQARLSAYGTLRSALESFQDSLNALDSAETTAARRIQASNEDAVSVSVDETAVPARYDVDILNLATVERLTSGAFTGSDAVVGTGTLSFDFGGETFDVDIDSDNNTLAGIRDAINAAAGNAGVQATIVNADAGSYLILSGDRTGASQTITVTESGGDGGLSALTYDPDNGLNNLTRTQAAGDASAIVNSFLVYSDSNEFSDVIDGVTFTALEATAGNAFTIDVSNDQQRVSEAVKGFVAAYNALVSTTDNLSAYDADTQVAGPLQGDAALRSVTTLLRRSLSEPSAEAAAAFDTLQEIGISITTEGKLELDETALTSVLETDFAAIAALFGGDAGVSARLNTVIDAFTDSDGILKTRTDGIDSSIAALDEQREALARRLTALESRLLRQFNGLDALIGQLNTTSSFLSAQLANLPTPQSS